MIPLDEHHDALAAVHLNELERLVAAKAAGLAD